jgi:hypothetical protein
MANAIQVAFHGATVTTIQSGNELYVAMKPIVENIGLDWDAQRQRIRRHPVMNQGTVIMTLPSSGGDQDTLCIPLKMLNGWLFGIDSNRVKPALRDKVIAYQRECFDVLAQHFGLAQPAIQTLSPAQRRELQNAVSERAYALGGSREDFASVYRILKDHFKVPTYADIPASRFAEALELIETAPRNVPLLKGPDTTQYIVQQAQALAKQVQAYYGVVDVKTYTLAQDITFRMAFA